MTLEKIEKKYGSKLNPSDFAMLVKKVNILMKKNVELEEEEAYRLAYQDLFEGHRRIYTGLKSEGF